MQFSVSFQYQVNVNVKFNTLSSCCTTGALLLQRKYVQGFLTKGEAERLCGMKRTVTLKLDDYKQQLARCVAVDCSTVVPGNLRARNVFLVCNRAINPSPHLDPPAPSPPLPPSPFPLPFPLPQKISADNMRRIAPRSPAQPGAPRSLLGGIDAGR